MSWLRWFGCLVVSSLSLVACGSEDPATSSSGASGSGGGLGVGSTGVGGAGGSVGCDPEGEMPGFTCVETVQGKLVDGNGGPVGDMLTTVCGTINCNPGTSETEGDFTVEVGAFIPLDQFSTNPHGREQDKTVFYFPLPADAPGPTVDMGELLVLDMPMGGPSVVAKQDDMGAPAQSLTSNGVTLTVPAGVHLDLEFEDVLKGNARFEALAIPTGHVDTFAPGENLSALYAFYPFEAAFRPEDDGAAFSKVALTFPNDAGLAPDTPVEMLSHGSFIFPDVVKPATFAVVATGRVSADGNTIEMDAGQGVEVLTWIGIRPSQ